MTATAEGRDTGPERSSQCAPTRTPKIAGRRNLETKARLSLQWMDRISRTDGSAFTRQGEAWSEATTLGPRSFRVRLGGPFRGAWLANLSCQLAEQQISIDHVHARLGPDRVWIAELHLLAQHATLDPLAIDYP